jgi:hypothetical protein
MTPWYEFMLRAYTPLASPPSLSSSSQLPQPCPPRSLPLQPTGAPSPRPPPQAHPAGPPHVSPTLPPTQGFERTNTPTGRPTLHAHVRLQLHSQVTKTWPLVTRGVQESSFLYSTSTSKAPTTEQRRAGGAGASRTGEPISTEQASWDTFIQESLLLPF